MKPLHRTSLLAALAASALAVVPAAPAGAAAPHRLTVAVPAEGGTAALVASVPRAKARRVRVRPAGSAGGLLVTGGATAGGRLAVAVARPRGAAAPRRLVLRVTGAKPVRTRALRSAFAGGAPRPTCRDAALRSVLGRRLAGRASAADLRAFGVLAADGMCGARPDAAGAALLERLGLGGEASSGPAPGAPGAPGVAGPRALVPAPAGPGAARPSRPAGTTPPSAGSPGSKPAPPAPEPTPGPTARQCDNGTDDDGDGLIDDLATGAARPDPGCDGAAGDEAGEAEVSAACAAITGVGASAEDPRSLFAAVNAECGTFSSVRVDLSPATVARCSALTAESNFDCAVRNGDAVATARDGRATDVLDMPITLGGDPECSVPVVIVLTRPDGTRAKLVEPLGGCGAAPAPKAACANGADDDGDGQADALGAAGAADPDPGCSGPQDDSEGSETGLPAGCTISAGIFNGDPAFPGVVAEGCGTLVGAWIRPSGQPQDCVRQLGDDPAEACEVRGRTGFAGFAPTDRRVVLATHLAGPPPCGVPVTVALLAQGGAVHELRDTWCD